MKYLALGLAILLLCGCAINQGEAALVALEEARLEPKIYTSESPIQELLPKQDKEDLVLPPTPERSIRETIVENAMMYLGKRDGRDCSGFVNLINIRSGRPFYNDKELSENFDNGRKSRAMYNLMQKKGVAYNDRLPHVGDLVFFENTEQHQAKSKVAGVKNITHVGIVTRVDGDETVEFIHHSNGKNILGYMNFNFPKQTHKNGKKINTYVKRCPSQNGAIQTACLNIAFFVGYGTF
jgi:hypothetical protein